MDIRHPWQKFDQHIIDWAAISHLPVPFKITWLILIGFNLYFSDSNTLNNNTAEKNTQAGFNLDYLSVDMDSSSNNNVLSNNIANNNNFGFILHFSDSNTLNNNTADNNIHTGFGLFFSSSNNLSSNTASENTYGIFIGTLMDGPIDEQFQDDTSNYNNLNFTNIGNNTSYGVYITDGSLENRITSNAFFNNNDNLIQAFNAEISTTFAFNYWSEHISPDADGNGIVDTAYVIDGPCSSLDNTPVTSPYQICINDSYTK